MLRPNKNWKSGQIYKQDPKRSIDMMNLYVPTYQISQLRTPVAFIMNGRQIIIKKLPKNRDYFIDRDLGMFEINPDKSFFINKTLVYIYDVRNQNAINPGLLDELYRWANLQGIYKIRRADVEQAKRLRTDGSLENLRKEMEQRRLNTRKFMAKVLKEIEKENIAKKEEQKQATGESGEDEEYKKIDDYQANFIITENLFNNGYISREQAQNIDYKLARKEITTTDQLLNEIESFCNVYVTKPITNENERILDEFHTYKPRDIIGYIKELSKIRKGMKNLRTKPVINWFPSMYILFGAIGILLFYMIFTSYGGGGGSILPSEIIPTNP